MTCAYEKEGLKIVERGSELFLNKEYDLAFSTFKSALQILENSTDSNNNEDIKYMVQYLLSITLLELNKFQHLLEALNILINLEKSMESKYPIVYYGLAKTYIKLYRFNLALKEIQQGFDIINKGINFETFTAPPKCIQKESTQEGLLLSLLELQEIGSKWHYPDGECALENCQNVIPHCPVSRDIYYSDPSFNGFVNVIGNNNNISCISKYHPVCWKYIKQYIDSSKDLKDSNMIGSLCFKPSCSTDKNICVIVKIEIYNHEAEIIETYEDRTLLKLLQYTSPISKGAIKKKKQQQVPSTPSIPQSLLEEGEKRMKKILEKETLLKKLTQLRKDYFGQFEDIYNQIDFEKKKIEDASQFHRFLLEILFEYIKSKRIVQETKLISKWHETKILFAEVPEIQNILDVDLVNLLLKHTRLAMVGNYICIPQALGEVFKMFEIEVTESYKILTNEIYKVERAQFAIDKMLSGYNDELEKDFEMNEAPPKEYFEIPEELPESPVNNNNEIDVTNFDPNNMKEEIFKEFLSVPNEEEYFVNNNNYSITDENAYIIDVPDDKSNDETLYVKSDPNIFDTFMETYFESSDKHSNNISTVLFSILNYEEMGIQNKHALLEELYFLVVQDTISSSRRYMNEKNSKEIKQNQNKESKELQLGTSSLEKVKDTKDYELLLKDKDIEIKMLKDEQRKNVKLIKELENRFNQIQIETKNIYKGNAALKKENVLKSLKLQYHYNKSVLVEAHNYCQVAVTVLTKINNFMKNYCGLNINSDLDEWSSILNHIVKAFHELQMEFAKIKSWLELLSEDKSFSDINMKYIKRPQCPTKSFSSTVIEAFQMIFKSTTNFSQDLSELLSVLLSYSISDFPKIIPSHLSRLSEFLINMKFAEMNNTSELTEAKDEPDETEEMIDWKNVVEKIDSIKEMMLSYDVKSENVNWRTIPKIIGNVGRMLQSCDEKSKKTLDWKNMLDSIDKINDMILSHETKQSYIKQYDIKEIKPKNNQTEDAPTNDTAVDNNNVLEIPNDKTMYPPTVESLQIKDKTRNVPKEKDEDNWSIESNKTYSSKDSI